MTDATTEYPSIVAAQEPWASIAERRGAGGVYQLDAHPNVFVVTRYEDVKWILGRHDLFGSDRVRAELSGYALTDMTSEDALTMAESDPPSHDGKRRIGLAGVRPSRLRSVETLVHRLADALIDDFVEEGRCDFVAQFAVPLPSRLVRRLLQLGDEHDELIRAWTKAEASGLLWCDDEFRRRQQETTTRVSAFLSGLVLERFENPGDDLVSTIVRAQVERDGELRLDYVRSQVAIVVSGGIRTTAYFLPNMMHALVSHPEQLAELRADPGLMPNAIEEALRYDPPLMWSPRRVLADVEISGQPIPKGAFVVAMLGSANHDDQQFGDAARLDIHRPDARGHLAFGYGRHTCLGAPLARLELRIAFEHLLTRLHDLRFAPGNEFRRVPSASFHGFERLHLEFRPGPRLARTPQPGPDHR